MLVVQVDTRSVPWLMLYTADIGITRQFCSLKCFVLGAVCFFSDFEFVSDFEIVCYCYCFRFAFVICLVDCFPRDCPPLLKKRRSWLRGMEGGGVKLVAIPSPPSREPQPQKFCFLRRRLEVISQNTCTYLRANSETQSGHVGSNPAEEQCSRSAEQTI